jgi:two-component system response regulator DesR
MISVLVVDGHPAVRGGLDALLGREPDIECVAAVAGTGELWALLRSARPDVVVLDPAVDRGEGMFACFRIKHRGGAPGIVLYTATADRGFSVPASVAQADEIVVKGAPADELLAAIRRLASGARAPARLDPELVDAACARLDASDLPVARLLVGARPVAEIAARLGVRPPEVWVAALRILRRLQERPRP